MNDLIQKTERYFHEKIPLTRAMGLTVESYDAEKLVLAAPLEPNHNHLGTAFGGSLSVMATLAGYGVLWLEMEDPEVHVVVKSSTIHYRHPVRGEIRSICKRPDQPRMDAFKAKFRRTGKAGIELAVTIVEEDRVCVDFRGVFVAVR